MRYDRPATLAIATLLAVGIGCGNREPRPEAVPVDKVNCARCGMLVSSEPQSAERVAAGEETLFYDDIGCLATDATPSAKLGSRFVHVDGGGWTAAEKAFYARPGDVSTPMGYGVVAFTDSARAAARDREGKARTWQDLVRELAAERPATGEKR
jgi:copper chaperone NosL